jgi:L-amino acid N-acyltransferase YncA
MTQLNYREAVQDDLEKIIAIYNSTIASGMVTADTEPVSVESRQNWFDEHSPGKRPLWAIADATVEISIYLSEEQRGKGWGKIVLQYCLLNAARFGAKTLLGFIFSHNEQSLKLFRHFGFEDWATLPNIALLDGQERGLKILGKRLDQH